MPDQVNRAEHAKQIAESYNYTTEFERDESTLADLMNGDFDEATIREDVHRYLVIATEDAGEGPADNAMFFATKKEATSKMGEYAREGWASSLYDLDADTDEPVKERSPR